MNGVLLLGSISLLVACGRPIWTADMRRQLAIDPEDGGALYLAAMEALSHQGADAALTILARLDALGWDLGLWDEDFPGLEARAEYRVLAGAVAARVPRVSSSDRVFVVDDPQLIPEGITYDPRSGAYYLGSIFQRKIIRVAGDRVSDLVPSGRDGIGEVLGLHVDARPGGLLWAVHNPLGKSQRPRSGLAAFDPETGALRRHALLTGEHLLNDLAITDGGDIYVTDTKQGGIYRLPAGGDELTPLFPPGTFPYPNGIVFVPGSHELLVADALGISLVEVPGGRRRRIGRGPARSLGGIDGLAIRGRTLVAVQNGFGLPRIVRFDLDPGFTRVESMRVLESANDQFDIPTTGVIVGDGFAYIANSQLRRHVGERLLDPDTLRPTVVLRAPLSP
jgi:sugar lactone lactonase YvrE